MTVEEVRGSLDLTDNGAIKNSIRNCLTVFQNDPVLQGAVRYNILTERIDIVKPLWWSKQTATLTDTDLNYLMLYLEDKYSLTSEKKIQKALSIIADSNKYHPIRDYLNGLEWDGAERIRYALPRFLGAEEGEYTYQALRLFMLGAISRVFKPGCKFEVMLCLVGGQGAGKSTFFRLLAVKDEWFSDDLKKIDDDNVYRKMQGHWIIEMSEMIATANAKSIEDIKSFISRAKETYKVPYATMYDELELDKLGDRKTALFLIMSDTDSTFNFLISMIYTQLFNLLCDKADDQYGGKLPVHVRCLIDECANIGQIPQLEKLVATIRSREISACLVLQTRSQLKAIYKDNADTIVGNMDSQVFLGGNEPTTLKELSEALGKETIDSFNNSDTRGNSPSYGTNYQKLGHELMSRDELAVLDGGKCILQLRGVRPFLSDKYDLTQHPNYKLTSDYDSKNALDIEKFLNRKEKIHPDDTFITVDADSLPPA